MQYNENKMFITLHKTQQYNFDTLPKWAVLTWSHVHCTVNGITNEVSAKGFMK